MCAYYILLLLLLSSVIVSTMPYYILKQMNKLTNGGGIPPPPSRAVSNGSWRACWNNNIVHPDLSRTTNAETVVLKIGLRGSRERSGGRHCDRFGVSRTLVSRPTLKSGGRIRVWNI